MVAIILWIICFTPFSSDIRKAAGWTAKTGKRDWILAVPKAHLWRNPRFSPSPFWNISIESNQTNIFLPSIILTTSASHNLNMRTLCAIQPKHKNSKSSCCLSAGKSVDPRDTLLQVLAKQTSLDGLLDLKNNTLDVVLLIQKLRLRRPCLDCFWPKPKDSTLCRR